MYCKSVYVTVKWQRLLQWRFSFLKHVTPEIILSKRKRDLEGIFLMNVSMKR